MDGSCLRRNGLAIRGGRYAAKGASGCTVEKACPTLLRRERRHPTENATISRRHTVCEARRPLREAESVSAAIRIRAGATLRAGRQTARGHRGVQAGDPISAADGDGIQRTHSHSGAEREVCPQAAARHGETVEIQRPTRPNLRRCGEYLFSGGRHGSGAGTIPSGCRPSDPSGAAESGGISTHGRYLFRPPTIRRGAAMLPGGGDDTDARKCAV